MTEEASPRIKRSFSIIGHSPDVVELRNGVWNSTSHTITDDARRGWLFSVVSALDGGQDLADVAKREGVGPEELSALLERLRALNALEESASCALDHYLDRYTGPLRGIPTPVRPVRVIGDPELAARVAELIAASDPDLVVTDASADPALRMLESADSGWTTHGLRLQEVVQEFALWRDGIVVWAGPQADPVAGALFNRVALEVGMPWLHGVIDGPFLLVGPTFHPGGGPCYACLETRLMMNLADSSGYLHYKNALTRAEVSGGRSPILPALSSLLCSYLALEAINLARTGASFTSGKMLGFYLPTWETTINEVLQVPGCAACSPVAQRDETELYFEAKEWLNG
ncbi:TOMM precursor leader peptide-binding protein [Streptosporangium sp. NPDC051023]|uniref:TOMM precursor leader peptide-binding protein n=1 Tax=Streptosporangium sp. NPDC051023 TaxID=3155410 RepID=UPI003450FABB